MHDIISLVGRALPYVLGPIGQEVGYWISYEGNLTKLTVCVSKMMLLEFREEVASM